MPGTATETPWTRTPESRRRREVQPAGVGRGLGPSVGRVRRRGGAAADNLGPMTSEEPRDAAPSASDHDQEQPSLADLPYAELHRRAFDLAEKRHDLGFVYDLYRHTRAMHAAADEGGSLGDLSGSLIEVVAAARETFSEQVDPEVEPLFRARFVTYLQQHGSDS